MNIKITYNWLLEYLETDADPYELQKYLSLCGPSVEKVDKVGDDYVLDIEVTSNRVDMASVFGIAQEAQAILPQFGVKSKLKQNPLQDLRFGGQEVGNKTHKLNIQIEDPKLCSRFTALVLSGVTIRQAPDLIRRRLRMCGIKTISNVIDISNYLMLSLGQPTHIFDYDKIGKKKMILRQSRRGEKITTLDGKEITLPGGDIVIEDGEGELIDLCGIMGGLGSSVTQKTKNILLFVQTYDKQSVRRTSQLTGQRTVAAAYFEKGLDEERVEPALTYGVSLLKKYAAASVSSQLYDIYPAPYKERNISIAVNNIQSLMGVKIGKGEIVKILEDLGFSVKSVQDKLTVTPPTWRRGDIQIKEDLVEEVARIFGYHNLPIKLQVPAYVKGSQEMDRMFEIQKNIKSLLKRLGLHELMNYSMVSKEMIEGMNLELKHHLKLSNPISNELLYMRTSLLPSLVRNIKENQGKRDQLKFFEIAKVYYPQKNDLPKEIYKVAIVTNSSFSDLKGIAEALLRELNISGYGVRKSKVHVFSKSEVVDFIVDGGVIGSVGKLKTELQYRNGLKSVLYLASFDLLSLIQYARTFSKFQPINPYAVIKEDLTMPIKIYADFVKRAKNISLYLQRVELVDSFKDKKTVRLFFTSTKRNLTGKEVQAELKKIKNLT